MSENTLDQIVKSFLEEFNSFNFDQIALRNPPSKHQRELKRLIDLVKSFELLVQKNEGSSETIVSKVSEVEK